MRIYSMLSDKQEDLELSNNLRANQVGQKFLYFGEGAEMFEKNLQRLPDKGIAFSAMQSADSVMSALPNATELTIISLGCGNLRAELGLVEELQKRGIQAELIGVDSSLEMLQIAGQYALEMGMDVDLRRGDITTQDFFNDIKERTKNSKQRVFTFFGETFANVDQKKIVAILYNLLDTKDLFCLDLGLREGTSALDDARVFEYLTQSLSQEHRGKFWMNTLLRHGITMDQGSIVLDILKEDGIGSIQGVFSFECKDFFEIERFDESIPFRKGEKIVLQVLRKYDPVQLQKYFLSYKFELLSFCQTENKKYGLFMFKKNIK